MSIPLRWEGELAPHHLEVVQTANTHHFLWRALHQVYPDHGATDALEGAMLQPLAVGGAMAVYKITVALPPQPPYYLVGKIPHTRRLVYASDTGHQSTKDTTQTLLDRLVSLAKHLAQSAPGLFPRSGGVWHGRLADGSLQHLLIEEFIPGVSAEGLQYRYDNQLAAGRLSPTAYQKCRGAAERLAVTAFIRLWDGLNRQVFTSDPSPWNVLIQPADNDHEDAARVTIIDLHSLEDNASLTYVIQRLAAVYGARQEIVEEVILPALFDVLGVEEGRTLLRDELPHLEAQAQQMCRNLGVDLHQPLLNAIRNLS
ncbi:hypothetical protein NKDENANG_02265 [Candidatus Entotheonellaceae bacterium PAL068K]